MTESDKNEIKEHLKTQLGFENDSEQVEVVFNENVEIIANVKVVREYITDNNDSISFSDTIKRFEHNGGVCQ